MITDEGFDIWYALWEDVLASDPESGRRMALVFAADCLRRGGHYRDYLDQQEPS